MADTLKADIDRFPEAAYNWDLISSAVTDAHNLMMVGLNQGWRFGILAEGSIDDAHDTFAAAIEEALQQGAARTTEMGDTLRVVAREFGMTDAEQAELLRKTKVKLEATA